MKPTNTEAAALKLLRALKKEYEREPSLLKCRPLEMIANEIGLSNEESNRAQRFLVDHHFINGLSRPELAALPTLDGFSFLEAHKPKKWTRSEIITLVGLILTILGLVVGISRCRHGVK